MRHIKWHEFKANNFQIGLEYIDELLTENNYCAAIDTLAFITKVVSHTNLNTITPIYAKFHDLILKKYNLDIPYEFYELNDIYHFSFNFRDMIFNGEEILSKFPSQEKWIEKHNYLDLFEKYSRIIGTDLTRKYNSVYDLKRLGISAEDIVQKKFKYYNWSSLIGFGKFENKTCREVYALNPKLLKLYFISLSHFILSSDIFGLKSVNSSLNENYFDTLEKWIIKIYVANVQSFALQEINNFESHIRHEQKALKKISDEWYMDAFENDESNLWNVD